MAPQGLGGRGPFRRWRSGLPRGLGELTSPPWTKAPLLLPRFPGILVALMTASLILGVASAASPLFLSSAGNAVVAQGLSSACPWTVGLAAVASGRATGTAHDPQGNPLPASSLYDLRARTLQNKAATIPNLLPPEHTIIGPIAFVDRIGSLRPSSHLNQLIYREDDLANVQMLSSVGGSGVWITDTTANRLRVRAGDRISLSSFNIVGHPVTVRVTGVFRDPAFLHLRPFWCTQETLIYGYPNSNFDQPPLMLVDRPTIIELAGRLDYLDNNYLWEYPVRARGLTLSQAQATAGGIDAVEQDLQSTLNPARGLFDSFPPPDLPGIISQATGTLDSVRGPVGTISVAARGVALLLMAAAGMYWVDRRRIEVGVLSAKGAGTLGLIGKVLLEAAIPAGAAAILGWVAAVRLIKRFGPLGMLDAGAPGAALRQVVLMTVAAVALMAVVAGISARREGSPAPRNDRGRWAGAPWELAVAALAAASLYEILARGTSPVQSAGGAPPRVDALLLLFPILFVAGGAGLATRGLRRLLPRLRVAGTNGSPAVYLASRRLAAATRTALALVTAIALSVGILAYSGTLADSVTATSRAKALVFNGAPLDLQIASDFSVPPALAAGATKVIRVERGAVIPNQGAVDLLGIDRSTFPRAAFWDRSFSKLSLSGLLDALAPGGSASPVPIAVAGLTTPRSGVIVYFRENQPRPTSFRTVALLQAFPGIRTRTPLVIMDRRFLPGANTPKTYELWAKGDQATVDRAVKAAGLTVINEVTAGQVLGVPEFRVLTWVFGFLRALGFMTGLIALAGLLLYLDTRQRAREVSYALARRMGLRRDAHRRSVVLELGGMLLIGFGLGAVLSWLGARIVYKKLDPVPALPPPALFRVPVLSYAATAVVLAAVAWVGAWWVQRSAERADVAQVMRLGG